AAKKFTCNMPECAGLTFGRSAELRRHNTSFHPRRDNAIWCPVLDCNRSLMYGNRPFLAREDKLKEHIKKMHK
ncbi:hypothetical protein BU25DRAFT_311583, partial [Macroventuria anomochaeta]